MNFPQVQDIVVAALGARVLGRDLAGLLRRAAAAGVRVGVHELRRTDQNKEQG